MTEWEKLQSGQIYNDFDDDLFRRRLEAKKLFRAYNKTEDDETDLRKQLMTDLFKNVGKDVWIEPDFHCEFGKNIMIEGQFRSYNSYENERNRLVLTVFTKEVKFLEEQEEEFKPTKENTSNEVILDGYICKKPIYRKTPFGREIADILLAVNRAYNKSDYIPCIAWGRNARFSENIPVGTEVKIIGRVQSRQYEKKYEDGTTEIKIAYEVSVASLEVIDQAENTNNQEEVEEEKQAI